jgi:DNA-binding transcriptional LysR family regulator
MNINQLQTLQTISKTMSFRKAGELLNLTQPAVSAQIRSLEEEFNCVLIDRTQPVSLTDSGKLFLQHSEKILRIVDDLRQNLIDLNSIPQGHIHISTTTSIAMQILPRVLSYFQDQFPLIKTTIYSMTSMQIMESVENGGVDIGITYLFDKFPALESSILYYDSFELIVSSMHPLSRYEHISINELRNIPFIMLTPDTAGRRFVDQVFDQLNIKPNVIMELSSSEEVKRMVELNLGASIISKLSVSSELTRGTMKMVKVDELNITHPVGVVYKSGRYMSSAMQQFIQDLKGMPENQFLGSE